MAEAEAWVMIPKLDKDGTGCVLDMRPIVLCKNCVFYEKGGCGNTDSDSPCKNILDVKPNWFCADGEKRE